MAAAAMVGCGSAVNGSWGNMDLSAINGNAGRRNGNCKNRKGVRVSCVYSARTSNPYKILKITPGASESEVKKAFRKLALQYHPDVCKGNNGGMDFTKIYEAYDVVLNNLRGEQSRAAMEMHQQTTVVETNEQEEEEVEEYTGGYDDEEDLWEEWMGWEGAGITDWTSHINPYI